jgi:alkaline phosphatase D
MIFTVTLSLVILSSNSNIALLLCHPTAYAAQQVNNNYLFITHGIASGDVTNQSVIIWSRANREAQLHVEYDTDPNFSHPDSSKTALANQTTDYTAHVKLEGLSPDTLYYYRLWFSSDTSPQSKNASSVVSDNMTGSFRTAINPSASSNKDIKFIFAADLGGQMHCRQIDKGGYSIFSEMQELSPDFFIANGDMIYAGDKCPFEGPDGWRNIQGNFSGISDPDVNWTDISQVHDVYLKHWQYNREDPYLQRFLQNTSMYSQWDDHEVINDFGASWQHWNSFNTDREGYPNIVKAGREAFFNYSPIDRNADDPNRIYRSFNWGPDLDLLILDARSYRSPNSMADKPENNKTMLGSEQLQWLKQKLLTSSATWKVISSDVPISVPTGSNASVLGRDGWASGNETTTTNTTTNSFSKTGFERELQGLLKYLDYNNIKNIVFVTTDVHFPANIRYEIDANGDGDKLIFHELISGPLSAFRFGLSGGVPIPKLDTTFNPKLLYEEGGIFNFGYVKIQRTPEDNKVHLIAEVRSEDGLARANSLLDLAPQ